MTRYGDVLEFSNSEIQTWMDCARRWWLAYHRGLRPKRETQVGPLALGSRVHNALEHGFSTPGRAEAMFKVLAASIEEDYPKAEAVGEVEAYEKECELALIMLKGFVEWAAEEGLDSGWEVVSSERVVRSPDMEIAGQIVRLKGKLDQMIRREHDDSLWMRDWKTTQDKQPVLMSFKPQLKTYLLLLALTEPDAAVSGGQFVFLRKVKRSARAEPPFYMNEEIYVSSRELESFWRQTIAMIRRMVQAGQALDAGVPHIEVVPPRPNRDCSWRCSYYSICDMFDDGSHVEAMLSANYVTIDPYAYYEEDPDEKETIE